MSNFRTTGGAPKRSEERVRTAEPLIPVKKIFVDKLIAQNIEVPEPNEEWHDIAIMWFESLSASAQCVYYEPSDWATAYVVADWLSQMLKSRFVAYDMETHKSIKQVVPMKGGDMTAFLKAATSLLVTETDRLKASVEIEREFQKADPDAEIDENVVSFEEYQQRSIGN